LRDKLTAKDADDTKKFSNTAPPMNDILCDILTSLFSGLML